MPEAPYPVIYCAGHAIIGHASTGHGAKRVMARHISRNGREAYTAKLVAWDSSIGAPLRDETQRDAATGETPEVEYEGKAWACGLQLRT